MEYRKIVFLLDNIKETLQRFEVKDWLRIISGNYERLILSINSGNKKWVLDQFEELLALYGGMGSFTDLFITNQAGHNIVDKDISAENWKFKKLQEELYQSLRKEISILKTEIK